MWPKIPLIAKWERGTREIKAYWFLLTFVTLGLMEICVQFFVNVKPFYHSCFQWEYAIYAHQSKLLCDVYQTREFGQMVILPHVISRKLHRTFRQHDCKMCHWLMFCPTVWFRLKSHYIILSSEWNYFFYLCAFKINHANALESVFSVTCHPWQQIGLFVVRWS